MPSRRFRSPLSLAAFAATIALACALIAAGCLSSQATGPVGASSDASADGGAPLVTVSTSGQSFGTVSLGASSTPTTIVITNTGTAATGVLSAALGGHDAAAFKIDADTCTGNLLLPAASCTVAVHFAPASPGTDTATLTISATPGGSVTVTITGTAAAPGALTVTPTTQDFGPIAVGSTSPATAFTVTNSGASPSGAITVALTGTDAAHFALSADTCTGQTLAPSATCTLSAAFAPTGVGTRSGSLTISAPQAGTATASLGGTAITAGPLTISPTSQDFKTVTVGSASANQTFTVTNTGPSATGTLAVTFTGTNQTEFAIVSSTCTGTLAAGAPCTVVATFNPTSAGAKTATLAVGGAPGGIAASSLTATGVAQAALSVTPTSQGYGSVVKGQPSTYFPFAVKNTGGVPTGALAWAYTGTDKGDFTTDPLHTTCTTAALDAGAGCVVAVIFKPSTTSGESATLTVSATPGGSIPVSLTGTGLTPGALTIKPATFTYVPTLVGQVTADQAFVVTNTGGGATGNLTASLSGSGASQFVLGADGCTGNALTGSGGATPTCTVNVHFAPTASGTPAATLVVTATGAGGSTSATLGGTGQAPATLAWQAASYPCGTAATGSSTTTTLILENNGDIAAGVPGFGMTGANPTDFAVSIGCPAGVAPRSTCNVSVTFKPKTTSPESATITATSVPGGGASTVLTGTGAVPAALTVTPSPQSFSPAVQGTTGVTHTLTITNTGGVTAGTLTPLALATSTGNASDFVLSGSTCGATLGAGLTCTVDATFKPTGLGAEATSLVATAAPGVTGSGSLTGTSLTIGKLAIDHPSNDFVNVVVGQTSAPFVFTLSNIDQGPTTALAVSIVGGAASPFKIASDTCQGVSLNGTGTPGSTCTVGVTFTPPNAVLKSDTLQVTAATGGTVTSALSGTGLTVAALALTNAAGTSVPFGSFVDGSSSSPVTFTVHNNGQQTSGTITFNFGGANPGDFSIGATNCPTSVGGLANGATCTAGIVFTPSIVGGESATLTVSAAPGGTSAPTLNLLGTGYSVGPELQISPAVEDWGNVINLPQQSAEMLTITNVGGAATGTMSDSLSGPLYSLWTDNCTGSALASGASCRITVLFDNSTGAVGTTYPGSLMVTEPTGASDTVTATLTAKVVNGIPLGVATAGGMGGGCAANDAGIITSSTETFTVTNNGGSATGALTMTIAPSTIGQFVFIPGMDNCTGTSLAPTASCTFQLQYQVGSCQSTNTTMRITGTSGVEVSVGIAASMG